MAHTYSLVVIGSLDGEKGDKVQPLATTSGGWGDYDNTYYHYRKFVPWVEGLVVTLVSGCPDPYELVTLKNLLEAGQFKGVNPAIVEQLTSMKCHGGAKMYLICLDVAPPLFFSTKT